MSTVGHIPIQLTHRDIKRQEVHLGNCNFLVKKQKPVTVLEGLILFMMNLVLILVHIRHKTFIFKLLKIDLLKKAKTKFTIGSYFVLF